MSSLQIRVCGRYKLEDKLYEGRLCSVYSGKNVQSQADCAIKCESIKISEPKYSLVLHEGKVLEEVQGGIGIPNLLWSGQNGDFNFVITELLGASLEDYFSICQNKFSVKTVLMIADKILSSLQFIHYKGIVHRDIKPANFVVGLGKKLHQIYTIDLAYACQYIDLTTNTHRVDKIAKGKCIGTLKFASLNVLKGHRNSRRDDLESLGLMLVYFLKGSLPWETLKAETPEQIQQLLIKSREQISVESLCEGIPTELLTFFKYVATLGYADAPDYNQIKRIFKEKLIKQNYQYDHIFDWLLIPLRLSDSEISSRIPLNRVTKKDNTHPLMCNMIGNAIKQDIDHWEKRKLSAKMEAPNQQEKGGKFKAPEVQDTRVLGKKTSKEAQKEPRKTKDDCVIY